MKSHVFRPLWVAIALVALILLARPFLVPDDFGVHGDSFTYNYHRLSNVQEWQDFPVKYMGRDYCTECHEERVAETLDSVHAEVQCENCHGPAAAHPDASEELPGNTAREHCLRCHQDLGYPNTHRASLAQVNDRRHKRRKLCIECHNPHNPGEE